MRLDQWQYSALRDLIDTLVKLGVRCHLDHLTISIMRHSTYVDVPGSDTAKLVDVGEPQYEITYNGGRRS